MRMPAVPLALLALVVLMNMLDLYMAGVDGLNTASSEGYGYNHKHEDDQHDEYKEESYKEESYEPNAYRRDRYDSYDHPHAKMIHLKGPHCPPCPPPATDCTGCGQCPIGFTAAGPAGAGKCNACQACAEGSTTSGVGVATCGVCLPGYGDASCQQCLAGTYSTGGVGAVCEACPTGKSSNPGAQSPADCQDAACLAEGYIGIVIPSDGSPVTVSKVPECRTLTGVVTDCLGDDPAYVGVVPFYIEPASRERTITVTTCPQRVDPTVSSIDTVVSVFSVSTDSTCSLTYENCNDDWTDDYTGNDQIEASCSTYDDYLSYIEITVPADAAFVVTVSTYDNDNACEDGTANPTTPFTVSLSESCIACRGSKVTGTTPATPPDRKKHKADKKMKCSAKNKKTATKKPHA